MDLRDTNKTTGFPLLGPQAPKIPVAAFRLDVIEELIRTKGILAFHARHAINPDRNSKIGGVNVAAAKTERTLIYYDVRPLRIVPQDFSVRDTLTVMGLYSTGTVMMNVDGKYLDGSQERVFLRPNDLIILNPTVTELYPEVFEFKSEDKTKLQYRVASVDYMATGDVANGNGTRFSQDSDFAVTDDGYIEWLDGGNKPKNGEVVSIVYYMRPIFIIRAIPHSLRLLPSNELGTGAAPRKMRYAPQLALLEYSTIREGQDNTIDWFNVPELQDWEQYLDKT